MKLIISSKDKEEIKNRLRHIYLSEEEKENKIILSHEDYNWLVNNSWKIATEPQETTILVYDKN